MKESNGRRTQGDKKDEHQYFSPRISFILNFGLVSMVFNFMEINQPTSKAKERQRIVCANKFCIQEFPRTRTPVTFRIISQIDIFELDFHPIKGIRLLILKFHYKFMFIYILHS